MKKLFLLGLLLFPLFAWADQFCGLVVARNGLNVRAQPSLKGDVLYKLPKGATFKYHPDSYTGVFETIQDGTERIKGQWLKIDLYKGQAKREGYLFLTPSYAIELHDCRSFRHRMTEEEIYQPAYETGESAKQMASKLQKQVYIQYFDRVVSSSNSRKESGKILFSPLGMRKEKDTVLLRLATGKDLVLVSQPHGTAEAEELARVYFPIGYSELLKAYLISEDYWEGSDYHFISQVDGSKSPPLFQIPTVSPNRQYLLVLDSDSDEGKMYFAVYKWNQGQIRELISYSFENWSMDGDPIWVSGRTFLLPVRSHEDQYNWVDEDANNDPQAIADRKKARKTHLRFELK